MNVEQGWKNSVIERLKKRNGREVIIYGSDLFSGEICDTVEELGVKVKYIIDDYETPLASVKNSDKYRPSTILSKEMAVTNFVLVAKYVGHHIAYDILLKAGFKYEDDFSIMNLGGFIKKITAIDSLLTYNRHDDYLGFKVFGDEASYRIVTLGNSTSDPYTGGEVSWSEHLYEIAKFHGDSVQVICGAMTGYTSTQELLKLSRDVLELKPNLVIDMSGYNDIEGNAYVPHFPYLHKYQNKFYEFLKSHETLAPDSMDIRNVKEIVHGIEIFKNDYEIWIDNLRKMYALCKEFDVAFLAYLQPMVEYGNYKKGIKLQEIVKQYIEITGNTRIGLTEKRFCDNAKELMKRYKYIKDLTDIFSGMENIYYDTCHCNSLGNKIIAEKIYKDIKPIMEKVGR